jgi:hypothetical protein
MKYQTYDELISLVAEFRLKHRNLTDDERDKLVKQTFMIDQATLRELDGVGDLMQVGRGFDLNYSFGI